MKAFALAAFGLAAISSAAHAQTAYDDYEAVVIEAAEPETYTQRRARQAFELQIQPDLAQLGVNVTGQPCQTGDGRWGKCVPHKECYKLFRIFDIEESDSWIYGSYDTCREPTTRGLRINGVCCPHQAKPVEQAAEEDPDLQIEFQNINKGDCGRSNYCAKDLVKIVRGEATCQNQYPFMAAMLNRNRHFCGGSLIDKRHILTAAHCVAHMSKFDVQNLKVNLGDHRLDTKSETSHESYKVRRVIRHKGFDQKTLHSDVAILTLDKDVPQFNDKVAPICLSDNPSRDFYNDEVEVAGWGTIGEGKKQSTELRKVKVKVWANTKCKSSYGSQAPGGIIDSMVCANHDNPLRDSCSGDSGGPLYTCQGGACQQLGIVSWGIGCAKRDYPGVYTRVTSLLPWIAKIVAKY